MIATNFALCTHANSQNLVEGKCGVAESGAFFSRCTVIRSGSKITTLASNNSTLVFDADAGQIIRIGPLDARSLVISPGIKQHLGEILAGLNVSESDARRSNNVKLVQARSTGNNSPRSLLFIANRDQRNLDALSATLANIDRYDENNPSAVPLHPTDSAVALQEFARATARIQGLYEALMFEEADRVLDRTKAEISNFERRYANYNGFEDIQAVLYARIAQLEALRNLRSYDYQIAQWQAQQRYDRIQREKAAAEERARQHQYKLAVERRKAAEANARTWWAIWMATRPALVNTVINNVIITR